MINKRNLQINESNDNFCSLLKNEEEERKKLSYELQNSVNHLLFSAKLNVYLVENKIIKNRNTTRIKKLLDTAINEVINISYSLYPVILDEIGLIGALNNLLKEYKRKTNIIVHFENHNIPKQIPFLIKTNIFRIIQEILSQVILKADVSQLFLSISKDGSWIIIKVKSNGKRNLLNKFIPSKNSKSPNIMLNIKKRLNLLSGELDFGSIRSDGIEINMKIPLDERNEK